MTVYETALIFAGIPAAVVAVVTGAVYGVSARRAKRYRPGRPFEFVPVWFVANPRRTTGGSTAAGALPAGARKGDRPELPTGGDPATQERSEATAEAGVGPVRPRGVKGVVHGSW